MTQPVLYQFPVSHFCEKARWALDHKRVRYRVRNLFPGVHTFYTRPLAAVWTVPVLTDDGVSIGDSTAIAMHLDATRDGPSLYPRDESERARVVALEEFFDKSVGPAVRSYLYAELLAQPGAAAEVFFRGYGLAPRVIGKQMGSQFESTIRKRFRLRDGARDKHLAVVREGLDRLDRELGGDETRYLVGSSLSIADITAASLLGPVIGPAGSPWFDGDERLPAPVRALRNEVRERACGQWVVARYALDRGAPLA